MCVSPVRMPSCGWVSICQDQFPWNSVLDQVFGCPRFISSLFLFNARISNSKLCVFAEALQGVISAPQQPKAIIKMQRSSALP